MNPQLFLYLATLITTTLANELSYSPTNVFNTSEHDILNVRYLVEISPSRFHTEAAVDGTSDSMIITTIDPESLSNTLRAIVSAGESDFDHLKEAILSSNEAILSIATSQKYLSMILRESVESLSSAIDYNDRLRAYKTEVLPLLAANLIEKAKTDLYRRRRDEPVNTVLMDLVYDVYRRKEGYRMTTCSAVFDKTITKGSVSRYRHRIDCAEQPRLDHESVLEYISKGICVETVTEEVYVTQDIYNDKSKELPIGYRDEESFAMEYIRPSEILSLDSTYAIDCTNYASEILGNYYFHHLMAKRSDLMLCHGEPYVFPSLQADTSNCRRSSTGIGAFLNIGFSSMNFKKLTSLLSKPGSNSEAVVNIRSNFTNTLGSRRDVKVVGPPPCARACCSGEYHRQFQDFSGTEVLFESSYTGLWYSDTPNTDSFSSLIEFMKGDLPTPYESSSEGVFYYKSGRKLYLGKLVKTLVTKVDEGYMTCFNGILKLTNFTGKKVPLVKIPSEISYCKSNSRIIVPAISKRDDIYVINDNTQKYSIGEDCPPDSDDCEFFRSFDCDFTGKCSARDVARMYTSEASRCNNVIRVDCRNSTECVTIPDAEFILVDEETKELCSVKFNSTSTVINNYEIKTNSTEHIDQKIEELINEQIKTVEESLDRTIVNVRESSLKLEAYESAFRNITIELNLTYYRVGEEIAKVKADVKELKARMDAVETDIKILDYRTNALDKKIDNVNKRLDNGDFKHGGDVDIAKGFEDLGEGALDLIRGVIKLPFQAGSFIDVVIKVVCYIAIGLICLFILYCLFQLIRCIMPIFKSWNHKRNLEEVKERVAKRSEKIMDTPSEAQREIVPMFGTLTRRRTQDELEMHELSRSSIYFTEDLTVVGRPDKKFSVVEVENLPTIKLLKLCNLIKKVSSSEGEYYLIRKSAPAEKPSVLRHYDLDSDACKYIVFAYRNGGFRIHF